MYKFSYVENEQYSDDDLLEALKYALQLREKDSEIGRIVLLVYTSNQFQLINSIFTPKQVKQGRINIEGIPFHFNTVKTFTPSSSVQGSKRDILIVVGISPSEIQSFEDEYGIKYFIYVPWNFNECLLWLKADNAIGIKSKIKLVPEKELDKRVKNAIDWLKSTSYPNEGFHHPLDEDRLKSVSMALREFNIEIIPEAITDYCSKNGILYEASYKMINYFLKAKNTRLKTSGNYSMDFFKKKLNDE